MDFICKFCMAIVWLPFSLAQAIVNMWQSPGSNQENKQPKILIAKIITTLLFVIIAVWLLKMFFWPCLIVLAVIFLLGLAVTFFKKNIK